MGTKKELIALVDEFVEEKNAKWEHEDWLRLTNKVKEKGLNVKEEELGKLLEKEREIYKAKKIQRVTRDT